MFTIILIILIKKLKHYKRINKLIDVIISELDDATLNKINKKCTAYITYTIDNKQVNNSNKIKTKQKEFAYLNDKVVMQLALNQFELNANKSDVLKSTFDGESKKVDSVPTEDKKTPSKSNKKEVKA